MAWFLALTCHVLWCPLGSQPASASPASAAHSHFHSLLRGGQGISERQSHWPGEFLFMLVFEEFQRLHRLSVCLMLCTPHQGCHTHGTFFSPLLSLCGFLRHTWAPRLGPATCPAWLTWSSRPHTCSCPCQPGATWGRGSRTQPQLVSHPHACPSEGPQGPWFPAKGAPSGGCVYLCRKDRTQSGQTDLWSCHLFCWWLVTSGRCWTF